MPFALETKDGDLVGFALGSPGFNENAGNCVFMYLPGAISAFETDLAILVSELKVAGEHAWYRENENIVVHSDGDISLTITADGDIFDANGNDIGRAKPLPEET